MYQHSYICRAVYLGVIIFSCGIVKSLPQATNVSPAAVLTNAAQVRALTEAEAAQHRLVRLRGVAIGEAEPEREAFAIQDETAGIYFKGPAALVAEIRRGDVVEVEGVTDPGEFAPFVMMKALRKLGTSSIPEPRRVDFEQLITGQLDAQWVELSGVVRSCEKTTVGPWNWKIELATGGGRLAIKLHSALPLEGLVDAEIRVQGVCYYEFNRHRQLLGALLLVPRGVPLVVELPATPEPYTMPLRPCASLLQFTPQGNFGHRVHVRGIVTCYTKGEFLWIRDGAAGLRVKTRQGGDLVEGDTVEIIGFPNLGGYAPILENATFQKQTEGPALTAWRLSELAEAADHDADLVELEADLVEKRVSKDGYLLVLQCHGAIFTATLHEPEKRSPPSDWLPGSKVRIKGICSVDSDNTWRESGVRQPRGFQLLLRSTTDLIVIKPPSWWTREHILWVLSIVVALSLLAVVGVVLFTRVHLRDQKTRRVMAEAELSAILAERSRMAREIHDTLAQGLGAISMQLVLVKDQIHSNPPGMVKHLELAHRLVRDSLNDARNSIWNMRSQVLETGDLSSALAGVLRQLTDDTNITGQMQVVGQPCRLPPMTENALLRVGQESITNSVKHAKAGLVEVRLEFARDQVRLLIRDDGCGFDTTKAPASRTSFGLIGMRERLAQLGGEFGVCSNPGRGTEITIVVPIYTM